MAWCSGASIFAAAVALWIATTDRRQSDVLQTAEETEKAAGLARRAGLVRLRVATLGHVTALGPSDASPGFSITNWTNSELFDVTVKEVVIAGTRIDPNTAESGEYFPPVRKDARTLRLSAHLPRLVVEPGAVVTFHPEERVLADHAVVCFH